LEEREETTMGMGTKMGMGLEVEGKEDGQLEGNVGSCIFFRLFM
jgi:hypothetical protein